jgi:hypothetical protein
MGQRLMPSRAVLLMTLLLLASAPSQAAQPPASPAPVVEFDHDGQAVEGFVLYATRRQDGVQRRLDLGMPSKGKSGRFHAALPALAPGTWQLELAAYNSAGESPRTKAEPSEVRIDSPVRQPPPAATPPTAKTAAPGAREPSPQKPPPQKPSPQKKKKGAMGKLWGLIVGEDDPK